MGLFWKQIQQTGTDSWGASGSSAKSGKISGGDSWAGSDDGAAWGDSWGGDQQVSEARSDI